MSWSKAEIEQGIAAIQAHQSEHKLPIPDGETGMLLWRTGSNLFLGSYCDVHYRRKVSQLSRFPHRADRIWRGALDSGFRSCRACDGHEGLPPVFY